MEQWGRVILVVLILVFFVVICDVGENKFKPTDYVVGHMSDGKLVLVSPNGEIKAELEEKELMVKFISTIQDKKICESEFNSRYCVVYNPCFAPVVKWGYDKVWVDFTQFPKTKYSEIEQNIMIFKTSTIISPDSIKLNNKKPVWVWTPEQGLRGGQLEFWLADSINLPEW